MRIALATTITTMHVDFDPLQIDWSGFVQGTISNGIMLQPNQGGGGASAGYPVFTGLPYQRGAGGLGSLFRSFLRYLIPIGKQVGVAIGRQGLETGSKVLSSVLDGNDVKDALVNEGRAGLKNLLDKAADTVSRQQQQKGSGNFDFKRYKKNLAAETDPPASSIGRTIKRRPNTGLFSTIGPLASYQSKSREKSHNNNNNNNSKSFSGSKRSTKRKRTPPAKRIRIDGLGTY